SGTETARTRHTSLDTLASGVMPDPMGAVGATLRRSASEKPTPAGEKTALGERDAEDRLELLLQVADVRRGIERRAGGPLERLLRRELPAVPVEVLAQPLA